ISATKLDVIAAGEKELPREEFWRQELPAAPQSHSHDHEHEHAHTHSHTHAQGDEHSHPAGESHSHSHTHGDGRGHSHERSGAHSHSHRGLSEIRRIIEAAAISQSAKERAIRIFEALGEAEAKVHNSDMEKIHFHEVGAIDAIVDIVCASVGAEALGVDEWICSPLNVGGGTVNCAHGTFPIPAPATIELLKNAPVYSGEIQKELVTPTGAAIVSVLASRFGQFPSMKAEKIAYGAGTRNFKGHPNVLRLTVGETVPESLKPGSPDRAAFARAGVEKSPFPVEEISVLEANID